MCSVPEQLLDLVLAGRGSLMGARRVYRAVQNPVRDRLPAPRRILRWRSENDHGSHGRLPETKHLVLGDGAMGFYGLN